MSKKIKNKKGFTRSVNFGFVPPKAKRSARDRAKPKSTAGFTLIELLVAVSMFTIVTVFVISALLALAGTNDRAQALLTSLNNLDFSLEHMTRTIRLGKNYSKVGDDLELIFINSSGIEEHLIYSLETVQGVGRIKKENVGLNKTIPLFITAPEVDITNLEFYVDTSEQPKVDVIIEGVTRASGLTEEEQVEFHLQTVGSQRIIERQ